MVVEDGTGKTDSNSFVSLDFANSYFSSRDVEFWSDLEDAEKEVLLIKSTDFINVSFKWRGKKKTQAQALSFPRINCVDNDGYTVEGVPNNLKMAVCESAVLLNENGDLFQTSEANGAVTSEHIGSISFTYDVASKRKDSTLYDAINLRLRGLYVDTNKSKVMSMEVKRV